jgi:hypothetical protein
MGRDEHRVLYYCIMNGLRKEQEIIEISFNFLGKSAAPFINILPAARVLFDQYNISSLLTYNVNVNTRILYI